MSLLRKATIILLGGIVFISALVCLRLWIQIDGDLEQSYLKAIGSRNQPEMARSLDGMAASLGRLKASWTRIPGVNITRLVDLDNNLQRLHQRLAEGELSYKIKDDLMVEYRDKDLMPWFPYGYIVLASLVLILLAMIVPEIHLWSRIRRAWYKRVKIRRLPYDFSHLV